MTTAQSTHKLVRIKPTNNREVHIAHGVKIAKSDGWCRVPAATADALAKEPMNELNPLASVMVFDVMNEADAAEIAEAEREYVEPPGTVDAPKDKTPSADLAPGEGTEPESKARGRRGR
jgi:hypothetical protein